MSEKKEKVTIAVSQLLEDLENGLTRNDIAEKYKLSKTSVKNIFMNPLLKGKKTKKPKDAEYVLIEDIVDDDEEKDKEKEHTETVEAVEEVIEEVADVPETSKKPSSKKSTWGADDEG